MIWLETVEPERVFSCGESIFLLTVPPTAALGAIYPTPIALDYIYRNQQDDSQIRR